MLEIVRVPAFSDNYLWLVHEPDAGLTAVVDPGDAAPIREALAARGWRLTHILNTHHHEDHVGGNLALKAETGCEIWGPAMDRARIPGLDVGFEDGEAGQLGAAPFQVFFVPGHTSGHIAWYFPKDAALFCGDTIFALGCGRLFEGSPAQMWASLQRIRALPPRTLLFCAHEYTLSNARFAQSVSPADPALAERVAQVQELRAQGEPTVPSTVSEEAATNPFLLADDPALAQRLGMSGAAPVEVFAALRARKDMF